MRNELNEKSAINVPNKAFGRFSTTRMLFLDTKLEFGPQLHPSQEIKPFLMVVESYSQKGCLEDLCGLRSKTVLLLLNLLILALGI